MDELIRMPVTVLLDGVKCPGWIDAQGAIQVETYPLEPVIVEWVKYDSETGGQPTGFG